MKNVRFFNFLTLIVILSFDSNFLIAGGRNPRYHGRGIWTSDSQDSGVWFAYFILATISLIILIGLLLSFYEKHTKKLKALYKIISNSLPLIGILIFIVWIFFKLINK